ncbi:hypothetical protein BU17DRAFT_95374 [Hysterangium stoloniferum]|nr:hypothetical protein BU17DRAFT_95374 [Hysterangium stoloniferum]
MSTAITSSLYNVLVKSPLHTNLDEVASTFIIHIAHYSSESHYVSGFDWRLPLSPLTYIVEGICDMRPLSVKELTAIRGCIEFWLQPEYQTRRLSLYEYPIPLLVCSIQQDAWFREIAGTVLRVVLNDIPMHIASLTLHLDFDALDSLYESIDSLETFFDDSTLLTDHVNELKVLSSLVGPIVRLTLTHTYPGWVVLVSGKKIIDLTLKLIAGSSEPESACTTVRSVNTIAILVSLLPHCDAMRGSIHGQIIRELFEDLDLTAHSLLCVVATPSTYAWFRDIAGAVLRVLLADIPMHIVSLTLHLYFDALDSLYESIDSLETFFNDSTLLTDHINELKVLSSLIGPIVRLILTHTNPDWVILVSGEKIIDLTLKLIAGSSEPESACTTVRSVSTIAILVSLLPHCDIMRGTTTDKYFNYRVENLDFTARSFLCVVATPSTCVSVRSNQTPLSVLKAHGCLDKGLTPSIGHTF